MSINVYPVDAVSGAPSYTARIVREMLSVLVAGSTSSRPFGVISGVAPGTPTSTVTATSTTWTVKAHGGVIDAESSNVAGPYFYANNANATGSVTAADATNPRIDILYVQIDDPAEGDGTSVPAASIQYKAGVASGSPAVPTPTVTRSLVLAQIRVPQTGGGSPTVTWVAPFIAAAGAPFRGSASGTTAADGSVVITHGLPFTPSSVNCVSKLGTFGTTNAQFLGVNTLTATTFTAYFLGGSGDGSGHLLPETVARTYSIDWYAYP